jgi:hypothetical protein
MFRRPLCYPLGELSSLLKTKFDVLTAVLLEILISLRVSQPILQDGRQLFTSKYGVTSQETWISRWIPWSTIRNKEAVFFSGREHSCCLPAGRCPESHFKQVGYGEPSREDAQVKEKKLNHLMLEFLHFWCLTLTNIYFCSGFNYRRWHEVRWSAGQTYG